MCYNVVAFPVDLFTYTQHPSQDVTAHVNHHCESAKTA